MDRLRDRRKSAGEEALLGSSEPLPRNPAAYHNFEPDGLGAVLKAVRNEISRPGISESRQFQRGGRFRRSDRGGNSQLGSAGSSRSPQKLRA